MMNHARPAPGLRIVTAAYAATLVCLPRQARAQYGDAMLQTFRDLYRFEFQRGGFLAVGGLWFRSFRNTVGGGLRDRIRHRHLNQHLKPRRPSEPIRDFVSRIRVAGRTLWKQPAFTLTTLGILAIGIGATTTIFSLVDGILLQELPYTDPEQLIYFENGSHTGPALRGWTESATAFSGITANVSRQQDLFFDGRSTKVTVAATTPNFFPTYDARPLIGRLFNLSDSDRHIAVVSHAFWQQHFGSDSGAVGTSLQINEEQYEIVGVLPATFSPPQRSIRGAVQILTPLVLADTTLDSPGRFMLTVTGRLRDDAQLEQAQAQVDAVMTQLAEQYPQNYVSSRGDIATVPLVPLLEAEIANAKQPLLMMLGAVGCMLLISCVTVANLAVARGAARQGEMALCVAIGASKRQVMAQVLTESLLLAGLGGLIGIAVAVGAVSGVAHFATDLPRLHEVTVDHRAVLISLIAATATGVLFGLAPALSASRTAPVDALKEHGGRFSGGRGVLRLRSSLVVAETGLAMVLLIGAGLLFNSFVRLMKVDLGFQPDNTFSAMVELQSYDSDLERLQFVENVLATLQSHPNISSASAGVTVPFDMGGRCCWRTLLRPASHDDSTRAMIHPTFPNMFSTLGAVLYQGRDFQPGDENLEPKPAIISMELAQRFFGTSSPLGQTLELGRTPIVLQIIGVVSDMRYWSATDGDVDQEVYVPFHEDGPGFAMVTFAARAGGDPSAIGETIRNAVTSENSRLPAPNVKATAALVAESVSQERFLSLLLLSFAAFAVLLAAGGIYGTTAYAVYDRRREIAVRLAVGATTHRVVRESLRGGAWITAFGLLIGVGGAIALSKTLEAFVFQISTRDWPTYLAVGITLGLVSLAASLLPARRAATVDPATTLRP